MAVNSALAEAPETVNDEPEGAGWFVRLAVEDRSQVEALMDRTQYESFLESL
ncbi:MAG: hypothetical protein ACREEX_16930 [Caulobacteraceae bacterium]